MGRHRTLLSVLRYYIESTPWSLSKSGGWVAGTPAPLHAVKLFADKEEANRYLIQKMLRTSDETMLNAKVVEKWVEL